VAPILLLASKSVMSWRCSSLCSKSKYSNGRNADHVSCVSKVEDRETCACRSCRRRAEHRTQDFFACAKGVFG
jgi:hypothetical protein